MSKSKKVTLLALGKNTISFYDPVSKIKLVREHKGGVAGNSTTAKHDGALTPKLALGIKKGHIIVVEKEYVDSQEETDSTDTKPGPVMFSKMTKDQLIEKFTESEDVTDEHINDFKTLKKDEMVEIVSGEKTILDFFEYEEE